MSQKVTKEDFDEIVLKSELPVMVDFYATWCAPCKMVAPIIDAIAKEVESTAKVVKVDIDEQPELAQKYGIESIPTIVCFKGGEAVHKQVGAAPKDVLMANLTRLSQA